MDGQRDGLIFNPMKDLDPKDIYTRNFWNPIKRIWVIVWTPHSHGRAVDLILEMHKKFKKKLHILEFGKTRNLYYRFHPFAFDDWHWFVVWDWSIVMLRTPHLFRVQQSCLSQNPWPALVVTIIVLSLACVGWMGGVASASELSRDAMCGIEGCWTRVPIIGTTALGASPAKWPKLPRAWKTELV